MQKEATRISGISKIDAKSLLRELGFIYEQGAKHDHYVYYLDGGKKILWEDEVQNKITIQIGRGSQPRTLRPQEARSIRSALELMGEGHLWNGLIGLPMKKKVMKKKVKIKPKDTPFFSAWANSFEKTFKALTFDKSIINIEDTLFGIYSDDALKDDPTLTKDSLKGQISSLINLISNNESHYVSSLSTGDILIAIVLVSSMQSNVTIEGIVEMLGVDSSKVLDVERHVEDLTEKGLLTVKKNGLEFTEEGIKVSNAKQLHPKIVKLSVWLSRRGLQKEAFLAAHLG